MIGSFFVVNGVSAAVTVDCVRYVTDGGGNYECLVTDTELGGAFDIGIASMSDTVNEFATCDIEAGANSCVLNGVYTLGDVYADDICYADYGETCVDGEITSFWNEFVVDVSRCFSTAVAGTCDNGFGSVGIAEPYPFIGFNSYADGKWMEVEGIIGTVEGQPPDVEECDDGNDDDDDGCSSVGVIEDGYMCEGEPSVCSLIGGGGGDVSGAWQLYTEFFVGLAIVSTVLFSISYSIVLLGRWLGIWP